MMCCWAVLLSLARVDHAEAEILLLSTLPSASRLPVQTRGQGIEASFPGLGAQGAGDGCHGGTEGLWGERLWMGVDEPSGCGEAAAEQLPSLLLCTCRPFPSPLFALEVAESSPGVCQARSLLLHFWRGAVGRELEKYW